MSDKPSLQNLLEVQAHSGQKDKAGKPYILHPLRVMLRMRTGTEMMVAVLHDVIEDTPVTLAELRQAGYPEIVCQVLDCLTKREGEAYDDFISRIMVNPLASRVKIADLEDNLDVRRMGTLEEVDVQRLKKYKSALERLTQEPYPRE